MKKRLLLLLFAALSIQPIYAYDFEVDGIYYNIISGTSTCSVTSRDNSSNSYSGEIVIPESVTYNDTEYSVTSIGNSAFCECYGLTSVEIPNSLTEIGSRAFWYCIRLTSVTIPNSVTEIGGAAFDNCSGLTSVTIGNSVTSIGDYAFNNCRGLTSVEFPNSVTSIGNFAFEGCSGLTEVKIPNSVTSIGNCVFRGCIGLTSVTIGNSVTEIGGFAFYGCIGLTSVEIPNSVTSIGKWAFYGCSGLTSVTIPTSVTEIGASAFEGCIGLKEVHISDLAAWCKIDFPSTLSNPLCFAKHLFLNGEEIKDLIIPDAMAKINSYAFYGCSGLTSVTISNSVTEIGASAFSGCSGLTSVEIPNSVTSIGAAAFSGCIGLTEVKIPNYVTEIGNNAFFGCSSLTEFHVNSLSAFDKVIDGVTYKCSFAAYEGVLYEALRALDGENINSYQLHLIQYPAGKTNDTFTIPTSVTEISYYAFYGCSGLTSVTIPNSVTSIGIYAFYGCSRLTSVTYLAEDPIGGFKDTFSDETYEKATLNYLESAADKIDSTLPWRVFKNRVGRSADFVESGIEEISGASNEITEVYNLSGVKIGESLNGLPKGIYIVRQGAKTTKLAI